MRSVVGVHDSGVPKSAVITNLLTSGEHSSGGAWFHSPVASPPDGTLSKPFPLLSSRLTRIRTDTQGHKETTKAQAAHKRQLLRMSCSSISFPVIIFSLSLFIFLICVSLKYTPTQFVPLRYHSSKTIFINYFSEPELVQLTLVTACFHAFFLLEQAIHLNRPRRSLLFV